MRKRRGTRSRLASRIPSTYGFAHLPRRPVDRVAVLGQVPGTGDVIVLRHAAGVLLPAVALLGQKELIVVSHPVRNVVVNVAALLLYEDVVEADPVALRVDVQFPHGVRLITSVAKALGECGNFGEVNAVHKGAHPVRLGTHAGEQGAPGGNTRGTGRITIGVADAAPGEVVDRRRGDHGMAGVAGEQSTPVIRADQQYIGLVGPDELGHRPPFVGYSIRMSVFVVS